MILLDQGNNPSPLLTNCSLNAQLELAYIREHDTPVNTVMQTKDRA